MGGSLSNTHDFWAVLARISWLARTVLLLNCSKRLLHFRKTMRRCAGFILPTRSGEIQIKCTVRTQTRKGCAGSTAEAPLGFRKKLWADFCTSNSHRLCNSSQYTAVHLHVYKHVAIFVDALYKSGSRYYSTKFDNREPQRVDIRNTLFNSAAFRTYD